MSKVFLSLLSTLVLVSCGSQYAITGETSVPALDGKMVFIKALKGNEWVSIDSTEVIHGTFAMEGNVDSVLLATLFAGDMQIMPFILEQGHLNLKIENAGFSLQGTHLNDVLNDFILKKRCLDDKAYYLDREESKLIMEGYTLEEVQERLSKEYEQLADEMRNLVRTFVKRNYGNVLGPSLFLMLGGSQPYPTLSPLMKEILSSAPDSFLQHPYVRIYTEYLPESADMVVE